MNLMHSLTLTLRNVIRGLFLLAWAVAPLGAQIKPTIANTISLNAYADNWCVIFINGKMVAMDSIDFLPHNQVSVKILPEYPMTIAVLAKDNAEPATGLEYGTQIGDAGFILKLGDGTVTALRVPWTLPGLTNAVAVVAGANHTAVLRADGTLTTFGANTSGQLGDGTTTTDRSTPVQVASGVASVSVGAYHTLYLKIDGTL